LKGLVEAGHEVTVCSLIDKGDAYEWEGVRVWRGAQHLDGLVAAADVVVSHLGDNGAAHKAARREGLPSVQVVNSVVATPLQRVLRSNPPDLLVFVAESLRDSMQQWCPSVVVRSPVWVEEHRTVPGDRVTLVNLSDEKGGRVFEALVRRMPDVQFLGVRGGYGKQIEPRGHNVEVIGTTRDMKRDVWSRTRVLLMPSKHETSGRVGLEACCSGIPVVCHPTPGLLETQGADGIFVHRDNLQGWVAEIRRLLDPAAWAEASARASERSQQIDPRVEVQRFVTAIEGLV
jgi:glycosyltransferase involved in cell wall biosynthesis